MVSVLLEASVDVIYFIGVTTLTQLLWAQQEMLGVAADIAATLVGFTAISVVDITTYDTPIYLRDLL